LAGAAGTFPYHRDPRQALRAACCIEFAAPRKPAAKARRVGALFRDRSRRPAGLDTIDLEAA